MDLDGIDAAFLYPSLGLFAGAISDPDLAAATCRAYNRWLADYCRPYPDRLFGVAMLPMQSIELAMDEAKFARQELGVRAGFLRPNPYNNLMIHDPAYEPFWSLCEDIDFAISKNTAIKERFSLQFRAEAFNLFNHPNLAQPSNSFTAANYGQITSTRTARGDLGSSRQLQLGMKLIF